MRPPQKITIDKKIKQIFKIVRENFDNNIIQTLKGKYYRHL